MSSPSQPGSSPSGPARPQAAKADGQNNEPVPPRRKSRPWLLVTGGAVVLLVVAFAKPLQRACTACFLLQSTAPSPEVLSEFLDTASDPAPFLSRLWRTQRLPHRQSVLTYLSRASASRPGLFQQMEPLVLEATAGPDVEVREQALATLERLQHPQLRPLALEQLSDADPTVRLIGLQALRRIATSNDVPIAIRLLDDPEPRVVVAAALVLRQATGLDFGIKSAHALPQFTCIDTNPPPAPDLPAIAQGVQRWHEWWVAHQAAFPAPLAPLPPPPPAALATPDFALADSDGKPVRLSQFRGKSVLLAFWSPGTPASLDDAHALTTLQRRNPDRLAVLGVCLPPAPSCADEHDHGHDHAHHHHRSAAAAPDPTPNPDQLRQAAATHHISFPMLLDPKGTIGSRFTANSLPTYILIDPDGKIRRRAVGFRNRSALAAMVEDVSAPEAFAASAPPLHGGPP